MSNMSTSNEPPRALIKAILRLPWGEARRSLHGPDYLSTPNAVVFVRWKRSLFAKRLRRWECIDVCAKNGEQEHYLIVYNDLTRMYYSGEWENDMLHTITGKKGRK